MKKDAVLDMLVKFPGGLRSLVTAEPDAVTRRQEGRSYIATEEDLRLRVINMEVCRGVQIVRRDEFQLVAADNHLPAFIWNTEQLCIERSVVPDEAFPQAGYVPLH